MQAVSSIKNVLSFLLFVLLVACNNSETTSTSVDKEDSTITKQEGTSVNADSGVKAPDTSQSNITTTTHKIYSNQRFRDVTVEKTGEQTFLVKGKGQIFEANFSWVIEDGHEELQQGHTMTDAGAPEWGDFSFTVNAPKKRTNSTLHLILFEISAKDGSRQYELPIPLY